MENNSELINMSEESIIQHWNYFCSLAEMLNETKEYVHHGAKDCENGRIELIHKDVYSDRFKQIIILASSEFENVAKTLCSLNGRKTNCIIDISNTILEIYPKITQTEVITLFWEGLPLVEWCVLDGKVKGIDWWSAYNALKHFKEGSYELSSLQNAVLALASLYVLNLYLQQVAMNHMRIADNYPTPYFRCKYMPNYVRDAEGELPDFGNKSASEKLKEIWPELFASEE